MSDFTFSELKKADAGYSFEDENGDYPFRGIGESILSLRELLESFPHLFVSINLKDSPNTYEGSLMPSKLWRLIEELGVEIALRLLVPLTSKQIALTYMHKTVLQLEQATMK